MPGNKEEIARAISVASGFKLGDLLEAQQESEEYRKDDICVVTKVSEEKYFLNFTHSEGCCPHGLEKEFVENNFKKFDEGNKNG